MDRETKWFIATLIMWIITYASIPLTVIFTGMLWYVWMPTMMITGAGISLYCSAKSFGLLHKDKS